MTDDITRAKSGALAPNVLPTGPVAWLRRTVPVFLVTVGLVGVAFWGHRTEWTFTRTPGTLEPSAAASPGLARIRLGGELRGRPDVPTVLRREVAIEFDSADAVDTLGIAIEPVWAGVIAEEVAASGEVGFDPARVTRLGPRAAGIVWRVTKAAGDPVAAGEVLALVDAAEAGRTKADLQQALVRMRFRERALADLRTAGKVVPAQTVREAEAAFAEAETHFLATAQALANLDLTINPADFRDLPIDAAGERLRLLGVPPKTPGLDPKTATANLIPVRAPFAGTVLSADAVAGEAAEPGRALFVVADTRRVWVTLHVRADDAGRVAIGQAVRFHTDGSADEFTGKVEWVGRSADEGTRTVPVRAALPNDAGKLRAGTLGQGRVVIRQEPKALLVPHAAVQVFRGAPVVFVRDPAYLKPDGPKAFHARPVRVGVRDAENTEVVAGLDAREVVVTAGSGLLLAELARAIDGTDSGRRLTPNQRTRGTK